MPKGCGAYLNPSQEPQILCDCVKYDTNGGNSQFLNLEVLMSFSKFIMTPRLLNNKRGKINLIWGENYIYSTLNKQGVYQCWRCLEYRREKCSAMAKTFIEGEEILNLPEHSHPSDIILAEKWNCFMYSNIVLIWLDICKIFL